MTRACAPALRITENTQVGRPQKRAMVLKEALVPEEPGNLVLALLRDMRGEIAELRSDTRGEIAELRGDIAELRPDMHSQLRSLRADVASDILDLEKRINVQIGGLRRAVMEYHSSAIGHGVLISEFEERLRRVEERLDMNPDAR